MRHIDYYKQLILGGGNSESGGGGGGITPTGTLELDYGELDFGQSVDETQDVTDKAEVHVAVSAKEPSGSKRLFYTLTPENTAGGTRFNSPAEDVKGNAQVFVQADLQGFIQTPTDTAELAYTMEKGNYTLEETADVTYNKNAHVTVDASALEPTGTKEINISQNGDTTEDVKDYESVKITANVVDHELEKKYEDLLDVFYGSSNVPDIFTNEDVHRIGDYAFYDSTVQEIHVPNAKQIGDNSFENCEKLSVLDAPNITHIYNYPFTHATRLTECHFPNLISYQRYAFESDPKSKYSVHLEIIDILGGTNPNNYLCFKDCFLLKTLIIRCTDGVCALYSDHYEGCFFESSIPNIYVPDALVEDYKAATNWSTYADQIHPLSEYVEPEV